MLVLYIPSCRIWKYAALVISCQFTLIVKTAEILVSQFLLLNTTHCFLFQVQPQNYITNALTGKTNCPENVQQSCLLSWNECRNYILYMNRNYCYCVSISPFCSVLNQNLWWDIECWLYVFAQLCWKKKKTNTTYSSAVSLASKLVFILRANLHFSAFFISNSHTLTVPSTGLPLILV